MRCRSRIACGLAALSLVAGGLAACGDDDGAGVREVGGTSGSAGGSGSGSGAASASGSASGGAAPGTGAAFGGYQPASDVAQHARVSLDVVDVNEALDADPVDFAAARTTYAEGGNSTSGDGAPRTLRGFATGRRDEPVWNDYVAFYGSPAWLDDFVSDALAGRGGFAGTSAAARRHGVQKGIQNGVMVAWTLHELVAAQEDVAAGELDPAEGAAHKVDEAWAFYHGEDPSGAPYATADERGEDFGTGSAVNEAMLEQFSAARDAALAGEAGALDAAAAEIRRQLLITYIQAALKYSATTDQALGAGDRAEARVQQAEGLAFYRVVAPLVAEADPAAARKVMDELDVASAPRAGIADRVSAALEGAYPELGITAAEIGAFSG